MRSGSVTVRTSFGVRYLALAVVEHDHDLAGLHLVPLGDTDLGDRAGQACMDGVLHLHGLEDDQELAGLDHVARRHRDPDHAAGHGGERGALCLAVGGDRVALELLEPRAPLGTVDEDGRADLVYRVPAGEAVFREHDILRGQRDDGERGARTVDGDLGHPVPALLEPVPDLDGLSFGRGMQPEADLLDVPGVVAPSGGDTWLHAGLGPAGRLTREGGGHRVAHDGVGPGERCRQRGEVTVEEPGVGCTRDELRVAQRPHQQVAVGGDPVQPRPGQGCSQGGGGLFPGRRVGDDLRQQGVVVRADLVAGLDPAVHPHAGAVGVDGEAVKRPGGRKPACSRVLGVEAGLDGVADRAPGHRIVHRFGQHRTAGDEQLEPDQVEPGDRLGHGVLDLEPGVHLEEVGITVRARGVEDELDGAGVDVPDRPRRGHRGLGQPGPKVGTDHRRGCLLDDLLMAALDAALALEQGDRAARGVGEHLDLDVPRRPHVAFEEEGPVPEGRGRLACRPCQGIGELLVPFHDPHAPAAPAGRRFDHERPAQPVELRRSGRALVVEDDRRKGRDARGAHHLLGPRLGPHGLDGRRGRADPEQAGIEDRPGELRRLGEESVAGVDGVCAAAACGVQEQVDAEVGVRRCGPGQPDGQVRLGDVRALRVGVRVDGHRCDAHDPCGAHDPAGDLAAVGHEEGAKGGGQGCAHIRNTP